MSLTLISHLVLFNFADLQVSGYKLTVVQQLAQPLTFTISARNKSLLEMSCKRLAHLGGLILALISIILIEVFRTKLLLGYFNRLEIVLDSSGMRSRSIMAIA